VPVLFIWELFKMAETIDDLTIEYEEEDRNIIKQLEKRVLTRGSWTTIMYLFQERDKKTDIYGAPKVSIRRYQKRHGEFKQKSKFNISNAKQGREVAAVLTEWFDKVEAEGIGAGSGADTPDDSGE